MKYLTIIVSLLLTLASYGQKVERSVIASSGEQSTNSWVIVEWTLGEPVVETVMNDEVILTQGFQQGTWYSDTTSIKTYLENFAVKTYPNPATDYLYVQIDTDKPFFGEVALYDINGKPVMKKTLDPNSKKEKIELGYLAKTQYLLVVQDENSQPVYQVKFIKST